MRMGGALRFCLLALVVLVWASSGSAVQVTPLFAWSNQPYFGNADASTLSYEAMSDASGFLAGLVSALAKRPTSGQAHGFLSGAAQAAPDAVLLVLGNQLTSPSLREFSVQDALQPLQGLLAKASSSLVLPHSSQQDQGVEQGLAKLLQPLGLTLQSFGCKSPEDQLDLAHFQEKVKHADSAAAATAVYLACLNVDAAALGSAEGVASELQQVQALHAALQGTTSSYVTVYTSQAPTDADVRRSLLDAPVLSTSGFGPYQVCGYVCMYQKRWLEAILMSLVLAAAAIAGLSCQFVLDTPTRFETPKDITRD